jgi:hypothetical protein
MQTLFGGGYSVWRLSRDARLFYSIPGLPIIGIEHS